jgi:hypothetical protein
MVREISLEFRVMDEGQGQTKVAALLFAEMVSGSYVAVRSWSSSELPPSLCVCEPHLC